MEQQPEPVQSSPPDVHIYNPDDLPAAAGPGEPPTRKKRKKKRLPTILRAAHIDAILRFLDLQVEHAPRRLRPRWRLHQAKRDRLMVYLGLFAGLRIGEICGLRIERVDIEGGYLTVIGKGDKEGLVPIHPRLAPLLAEWIADRGMLEGYVFKGMMGEQSRLSPGAVRLKFENVGKWCHIPFKLKPHALRHAAASQMLAAGADIRQVQEFLRHSSLATTQVYLHCDPDRLRAAVGRMWGAVGQKPPEPESP